MKVPGFVFQVHDERLAIARLASDAPVPAWAQGSFTCVARTPRELSLVCGQRYVPAGQACERDKIALGIVGVVPMTSVGILAQLCAALAEVAVPVFAISTYDTDYLLVSADRFDAACNALLGAGHSVEGAVPAH